MKIERREIIHKIKYCKQVKPILYIFYSIYNKYAFALKTIQTIQTMRSVNPSLYSNCIKPTKTRAASIPIEHFPLEKKRLSYNKIVNPQLRVLNSQGFCSSHLRDADADAGKYYYIHINPYDTSLNVKNLIDKVSPLLINPSTFESGSYYTYMIASPYLKSKKIKPQLYVTKTANMFEFGTKHHQIMYRLAKYNKEEEDRGANNSKNQEYVIYAAGEIMCENENTLHFNFISGTYHMKKCISNRRRKYEEAYITHMMKSIAPVYTNIIFQTKVLLTVNTVPLTKQYLSILRRYNIPVFLHDAREKCDEMKYAILRHYNNRNNRNSNNSNSYSITNDELQEIYVKTTLS